MDASTTPETEKIEAIKRDLLRIAKSIGGIKGVKIHDPKDLDKLDKYQRSLPSGDDVKVALDTCSENLRTHVDAAKKARASSFKPLINAYLESLLLDHKDHRIIENKLFRVGCLEVETKPENTSVRISFNRIVLVPWRPISSQADIDSALGDARKKLADTQVDPAIFPELLFDAYKKGRARQEREGKRNPQWVPIISLHGDVITGLFQNEVRSRRNLDSRFKELYYPRWAFLYNLDKYRSSLGTIPPDKLLTFEPGSQYDTEKFGVVLNGLSARNDYMKFCYLRSGVVSQ